MTRRLKIGLVLAAAALCLAAAASAVTNKGAAGGTIVFGTPQDPVVLDGALVSDGESLSVDRPDLRGLVGAQAWIDGDPPGLATSWKANRTGLAWTFNLRHGVKFQDNTPFNAAAVCFNFSRWYNFKGSFQNPDATYYWQTVFGGFRNPEPGSPPSSLYKGCKAVGKNNGRLLYLRPPSSSFLGALALTNFAIASPTALKKYGADAGLGRLERRLPPDRHVRHPAPDRHRAVHVRVVDGGRQARARLRNADYWGAKAKLDKRDLPADRRQRGAAPGAADAARSRATTSSPRRTSRRSRATRA